MHCFWVSGGKLGEVEIRGLWSPVEALLHINLLELRAIRLALKAFLPSIKGRLVQVFTDTTTMWYCNKQSRVWSGSVALCLWTWLERQDIFLVVQHLVGSLNARADKLSSQCLVHHEWQLQPRSEERRAAKARRVSYRHPEGHDH